MSILAMMPVRNEAGRYLPFVFRSLSPLVDGFVLLDDASDDATPQICSEEAKVVHYRRLAEPLFPVNEAALRLQLWEMTIAFQPDWILALDADEVFEARAEKGIPILCHQPEADLIRFPVYHFWNGFTHYRVDGAWDPLFSKIACLYRYRSEITYHWNNRKLHCGRFPTEAYRQSTSLAELRILHLGYARSTDQVAKFQRYLHIDASGSYCPSGHYRSIMQKPRLKLWRGAELTELSRTMIYYSGG